MQEIFEGDLLMGDLLMWGMFQLTGILAIILLIISGLAGFFGPRLRKILKGTTVLRIHRWCGIGALAFALAHGLIYMLYLI